MSIASPALQIIANAEISLNRDVFLRNLIRELAGTPNKSSD